MVMLRRSMHGSRVADAPECPSAEGLLYSVYPPNVERCQTQLSWSSNATDCLRGLCETFGTNHLP
jgi:hypothetical protein